MKFFVYVNDDVPVDVAFESIARALKDKGFAKNTKGAEYYCRTAALNTRVGEIVVTTVPSGENGQRFDVLKNRISLLKGKNIL